jgi:hypothetical protein
MNTGRFFNASVMTDSKAEFVSAELGISRLTKEVDDSGIQ